LSKMVIEGDPEMFDEKPESGPSGSASQPDGSSSGMSQRSEIFRVRPIRSDSHSGKINDKYFKEKSGVSAKITVDVTVEFEQNKNMLSNGF